MQEIVQGIAMPLFDRLAGESASAEGGLLQTRQAVEASIRQELMQLLNTRAGVSVAAFLAAEAQATPYGLPDFAALSASSGQDRALLSTAIARAIALFEPRLANVAVDVRASVVHQSHVSLHIAADAKMHAADRRMTFEMALDASHSATLAGALQ